MSNGRRCPHCDQNTGGMTKVEYHPDYRSMTEDVPVVLTSTISCCTLLEVVNAMGKNIIRKKYKNLVDKNKMDLLLTDKMVVSYFGCMWFMHLSVKAIEADDNSRTCDEVLTFGVEFDNDCIYANKYFQ